jgi:hypothetical protein
MLLQHIVNVVGIRGASVHRRIALLAPTCSPLEHVNSPFDDIHATLGDVIEAVRVKVPRSLVGDDARVIWAEYFGGDRQLVGLELAHPSQAVDQFRRIGPHRVPALNRRLQWR